jgi:type I restriction enzyme S subunit
MNSAQLLQHFDRISNAPDAIPRLRRFILDLAVRGKLVEQDPRDETASELLLRIQKEKAQLVRAGKLKLLDPVIDLSDQEMPFSTPSSWAWAQLANISRRIHYGFTASANRSLRTVRLLRITDIQNNLVDWSFVPGCEITADEVAQYRLDENDILIARTGGTIGKTFLVRQIPVTAVFASYLIRVQPSAELHAQYLKVFLESSVYWEQLQDGARGGGQPNVNGQTLGRMTVPIPPLAEQQRIVAKVDELMALCDRLETTQVECENRRDRLAVASLHRLNNGADADAFREHTRFYFSHLPRLTTRREHIQQLRQTILNLAVRGQLVPHDPNDEPVSELFKRIQAEKARRIKDGNLREQKPLPLVKGEQADFELPNGWQWVRMADVIKLWNGYAFKSADFQSKGVPVIRIGDLQAGEVVLSNVVCVSEATANNVGAEVWIPAGALLIAMSGATTGKVAFNLTGVRLLLNQRVGRIEVFLMSTHFIRFFFDTIVARNLSISFGTAIPNLSTQQINETIVPLPPLPEQYRIVAKVEELMALCDRLEAQLTTTQTESRRLLEAVLHEALTETNRQELADTSCRSSIQEKENR